MILRTALGNYPHTRALKQGRITSPEVAFDFVDVEPIHKAFTPMIRQQSFDLSELAIVVALQALEAGKPIVLLPAVVAARLQRGCLIYYRGRGSIEDGAIAGKRVGVRAYSQTTGMWVRAALQEDYDLAVTDMQWTTQDPSHLGEFADPAFVQRDETGKSLPDQLRDGDIDAAILGNDLPKDDAFAPVMPRHRQTDEAWYTSHGYMPINHVVVASAAVVQENSAAVAAAYRLLCESAALAEWAPGSLNPTLFGIDRLRKPLNDIIAECTQQGLLAGRLDAEALLAPAEAFL
jgi:4,5-dihydroxyphthalate decarboxylase